MKKHWIIALLLILGICRLQAQVYNGDLEVYLNSLVDILPGSSGNLYTLPALDEMDPWKQMISHVLNDEYLEASTLAETFNYKITDFNDISDRGGRFYIVEEKHPQTNYWGTYVFNREALRPALVIQAPHPKFDTNTGYQGVFCFRRLGALALFVSGTHRCNHTQYSACSGSTSVCSDGYESYRISDPAHNTRSVFQAGTEVILEEVEDTTIFVQLHGFGKQSTDPYVIMSNGTRITPEQDYMETLKNELFEEDNTLTFKVAHQDLEWDRLLAFSNTQGRLINGSSNPCKENPSASEGRFIHLEQERSRLRADSSGWYIMYRALEQTFPARQLSSRKEFTDQASSLHIYPNPATGILHIAASTQFTYGLYNGSGQCLLQASSEGEKAILELGQYTPGIYVIRVLDANGGIHNRKLVIQ